MNIAIIAGCRTPFLRSGTDFADLTAIDLGKVAVREALGRSGLRGDEVDTVLVPLSPLSGSMRPRASRP